MAKVKLLDPTDGRNRLDRYELIGELASGGMATVFLARLGGVGGFQRFVAIKRLHPHLAAEDEFIEMFLDEARLAAGIHHPNVVSILEVGQSESGYYLVMEYVEGDTLARLVARALSSGRPPPRPILLRVVLDALNGLHAAHELLDAHGRLVNLVHRDCSPQNILVGADGSARLTDFGVARASSRLSSTGVDRVKGKLAYMSPEQARGDTEIDRRTDVFAMGVILWEVLAGKRLFKADNEGATLRRLLSDPIPRLATVLPDIHPAIDAVAARALERDVAQRFQSAAEMADALERAAREADPAGSGVASPREVASYVQAALGQDIAAQRESVRVWISQSESSLPSVVAIRPSYDGAKLPLDRASAPDRTGSAVRSTLLGVGAAPLPAVDPEDGATQLMPKRASEPSAPIPTPAPSTTGITDVRAAGDFHDPTPLSAAGALGRVSAPPPRRRAAIAIAAALALLVVIAVGVWSRPGAPTPSAASDPPASPAPTAPIETAAPAPPPSSSAAATTATVNAVATTSATVEAAAPKAPPKTTAAPAKTAKPAASAPAEKPAAPKGKPAPDDLANPYR